MASRSHQDDGFGFALDDDGLSARESIFRPGMMEGKKVVVTGGGSGIGKATAFLFAQLGASVAICGRREDKLGEAAKFIKKATGKQPFYKAFSIRDPEAAENFMEDVHKELGGMDILINNAGGQFPQDAIDMSRKGWLAVIDTNLNGTWWMMQEAAKAWISRKQGGSIVNIVCAVERGCPQFVHTCAARAGVIYASKTLAVEWAPHGIRVNCLAPGAIQTEGFRMYPPEHIQNFRDSNPLKSLSDAFEMAQALVYMSSPATKFMTGSLLTIDGGQSQWGVTWPLGQPDWYSRNG